MKMSEHDVTEVCVYGNEASGTSSQCGTVNMRVPVKQLCDFSVGSSAHGNKS